MRRFDGSKTANPASQVCSNGFQEYIVRFLESKQLRKFEGKSSTLALRACPPSVVIHDPSSIPAIFQTVRQEVVVDKRAIKAAIEAGQDVPGCDLLIGKQTLIRR
ncbi:MAG: siphovirus Gp157 family protein [Bryobacteraceae bacterium]